MLRRDDQRNIERIWQAYVHRKRKKNNLGRTWRDRKIPTADKLELEISKKRNEGQVGDRTDHVSKYARWT